MRRNVSMGRKSVWQELALTVEKFFNEELNDLYCLPNIIRVIKSRRMRWAKNVARVGEKKNATGLGGET